MVATGQSSQSNWYFRVSLHGSRVKSIVIFFLPARKPRSHRCCSDGDFQSRQTRIFQLVINSDFFKNPFCLFLLLFSESFSLKITLKISKTGLHSKHVHTLEKQKRNDCFLSMTMETHFVTNIALKSFFRLLAQTGILLAYFVRYFEFMLN